MRGDKAYEERRVRVAARGLYRQNFVYDEEIIEATEAKLGWVLSKRERQVALTAYRDARADHVAKA